MRNSSHRWTPGLCSASLSKFLARRDPKKYETWCPTSNHGALDAPDDAAGLEIEWAPMTPRLEGSAADEDVRAD